MIKAPRGTQDILPQDTYKWQFIEQKFLEISNRYGFREIRIPTFEQSDLFCRSVGDTSDVVEKEMYTFEDKSSRLITLRPEGTAGVIRATLENGLLNELLPLKMSYIISCFRYEKPETGRLREFHQFGAELLGSSSPQADFQVIKMITDLFTNVGIENFSLQINSIGCKKCRKSYQEALISYMKSQSDKLCETCRERLNKNPMRILDCKVDKCQEVVKNSPIILDFLCNECNNHFEELKGYLSCADLKYEINSKIVRGLDYYTKTVFEFIVNIDGNKLTICGGGRYDNLVEELGGPQTPAIGFGIGLERIYMILNQIGKGFAKKPICDIYIGAIGEAAKKSLVPITDALREKGYIVETDLMGRSVKSQMKYANKIGARYSMIIGDNEIYSGKANLKNMLQSSVEEVNINDFSLPEVENAES